VSLPRIDSHQHFTREYLPELLFPILKRNRFDGSVVVNRVASVEENGRLLALAGQHDFIRAVVCWVDLRDAGLPRLLDEYQRHPKFRGVFAEPDDVEGLGEVARRDLTLDLPPRFALAASIAEACPGLRIALDDIGRPSLMANSEPAQFAALASHPNVFVKISGLITDAPTAWKAAQFTEWARGAIAVFGAERVMFGSDWPSYLPGGTWKEALAAFTQAIGAQTLETREHLLGGTARRFYRLEDD
jgi:L-fuconolactonase